MRKVPQFDIPEKANRILNFLLIIILLFVVRIWHLSVVQYDARLEQSRKPQRKVVVEASRRATIRDRFNIPLAINSMQYNAAILYSQFKQIPSVVWAKDESGQRVKKYRRREYIAELAALLGEELNLDAERLKDLIHAKASFYYHVPYVIKENLSEREYYRLKMLEKDWFGINVQRLPKRSYPKGKVAADIIGYMGAINKQEYETVIGEIQVLEEYLKAFEEGDAGIILPKGIASASQARKRLKELFERAYTINDYVGKTGIEGKFEEKLRGFQGKKSYYSDARGNFLRELPGSREPLSGERLLLTISAELQEFSEKILIQNDLVRRAHLSHGENGHQPLADLQPWIKGGAIVAMDPNNGEVLAMASYPRFDPNDFISFGNSDSDSEKRSNIVRWFETDEYIGQIWDQKKPLERETYHIGRQAICCEKILMRWENYLAFVLPPQHPVKKKFEERIATVKDSVMLQKAITGLLTHSGQSDVYWLLDVLYDGEHNHQSYGKKLPGDVKMALKENVTWHDEEFRQLKNTLDYYVGDLDDDYDKVLAIDLSGLIAFPEQFSDKLLECVGGQSLSVCRNASSALASVHPAVKVMAKSLYHEINFSEWRKANEKEFLKQKRQEEKLAEKYPKPYIDYLDQAEVRLFNEFWQQHRWHLLAAFLLGESSSSEAELVPYAEYFNLMHRELIHGAHQAAPWRSAFDVLKHAVEQVPRALAFEYLQSLKTFQDLNRPLLGRYKHIRQHRGMQLEKDLAMAFYPVYGYGYGRSFSYRQASTQGSIFKLAVAYAALTQKYHQLEHRETITKSSLNPLTITDNVEKRGDDWVVGHHADGRPIPQLYKGGRLPRSSRTDIGQVDIIRAIEHSSNPYFSLLAGDYLESPSLLADTAKAFSYGSKTGIELPAEIAGRVPGDLNDNRTGLYATAIGQHSLVVTPLQASVFLSSIANGGAILKPQIIHKSIGILRGNCPNEAFATYPTSFPFEDYLAFAGIDFPLFTATQADSAQNLVWQCKKEVSRTLFMPEIVRSILLEGMSKVVSHVSRPNLNVLKKMYKNYPEAIADFLEVQQDLAGKTSTAEAMENIGLDRRNSSGMYTHIWFGGIAFNKNREPSGSFIFRDAQGQPELVVVVYLRFGKFGKEAAPLAGQVVKKWREIKKRYRAA